MTDAQSEATIFLYAPHDVAKELAAVERVVGEAVAAALRRHSSRVTALRVATPDLSTGDGPADSCETPGAPADLIVGIFCHRLAKSQATAGSDTATTIEKLLAALHAGQKQRPAVLLYRASRPLDSEATDDEFEQFGQVRQFFNRLRTADPELHAAVHTFQEPADFESQFREHLRLHLTGWQAGIGPTPATRVAIPQAVTTALLAGFLAAAGDLVERATSLPLPEFAAWSARCLEARNNPDGARFAGVVQQVVDEIRERQDDASTQIPRYLEQCESNPALPQMWSAAMLEMIRENAVEFAPVMVGEMELRPNHVQGFKALLFHLRRRLALEPGFRDPIILANQLADLDQIKGFASHTAAVLDHRVRIEQCLATEIRLRRLDPADSKALDVYLDHLRERQSLQYSTLPLVKATPQARGGARIKDIFVPIVLLEKKSASDEAAGAAKSPDAGQSKKQSKPGSAAKSSADVKAAREGQDFGGLIVRRRRLVVLGPPGSGKTTVLKHMALLLAEGKHDEIPGWSSAIGAVPIFLRLRSFAAYLIGQGRESIAPAAEGFIDYLDHYYRREQRLDLPEGFFERLIQQGRCAVFLDGLDEVPKDWRHRVAAYVAALIARYRKEESAQEQQERLQAKSSEDWLRDNLFVLTSRQTGFDPVKEELQSADFATLEAKPLERAGIRQLIANLLQIFEPDPEQRASAQIGLCDAIFRAHDLTFLAGTPLFCTSLFLVFKYHGAKLPERRIDVLKEIVDLLLGFWHEQDQKSLGLRGNREEEEAGTIYTDVGLTVKVKKDRLAHIAWKMQLTKQRTEIRFGDLVGILRTYLIEEEGRKPAEAERYARGFLHFSHERSGLLVETDPSDPPVYAFTHEGFREFLVADALKNRYRDEEFVARILEHVHESTWDEIIALAGAHPDHSNKFCQYLIERCLAAARDCRDAAGTDAEAVKRWQHLLVMTARIARDMGVSLHLPDRHKVQEVLRDASQDAVCPVADRLEVALGLDNLGWMPTSVYTYAMVPRADQPNYYMGRNLVTNQQYARFLHAIDFADSALWEDQYALDHRERPYPLSLRHLLWPETNPGDKRLPKYWNDPKFGGVQRGLPVVGVSWYEASAYCRWLQRHWDQLEEAQSNASLHPRNIRLPTEREWVYAVFGSGMERRFPWDPAEAAGSAPVPDFSLLANVGKALDRTTPSAMFEHGQSLPFGLYDALGNVWEWQANLYDDSYLTIALRGGSYAIALSDAAATIRGNCVAEARDNDVGFRTLIEI